MTIDARKELKGYWQEVMKDQTMLKAIQGLLDISSIEVERDRHTSMETGKQDNTPFKTLNLDLVSQPIVMISSKARDLFPKTLNQDQVPKLM